MCFCIPFIVIIIVKVFHYFPSWNSYSYPHITLPGADPENSENGAPKILFLRVRNRFIFLHTHNDRHTCADSENNSTQIKDGWLQKRLAKSGKGGGGCPLSPPLNLHVIL